MAIEILEKGDISNSPTFTRKCPICGTKFTCKYEDATDSNWRGGYVAVLCPTCSYPVSLMNCGGNDEINHPILDDTNS